MVAENIEIPAYGTPPQDGEVTLSQEEFSAMKETVAKLDNDNFRLNESLQNVALMLDEKGWSPIYEYGPDGGLKITELHNASKQLRELVVGNPFVKRGSQLRNTYVWGAGVDFGCQTKEGASDKLTDVVLSAMARPRNQRSLFSATAQEELERAAYTDGNVFILGTLLTKDCQRIPISEIQGDLRNPDDTEEIWAYRRVWSQNPTAEDRETIVRWYYTDSFDRTRRKTIRYGGKTETFDNTKTMIDLKFNGQVGWAYGIPDSLPIIAWARLYKDFLVNGYVMSRAMAQFAYKVTSNNKKAQTSAAFAVATPGDSGSTGVMGADTDMTPMATAGKGYDFDSGRPLAAAMAAGIEVSLVALLSDPGAGGGSYGTAQTLQGPERMTARRRRSTWEVHFDRIMKFLGNKKILKMTWHDLNDDTINRILQAWTLVHNSGLFEGVVIQKGIADVMDIAAPGKLPDGYMLPNNEKSLARKDVDADGKTPSPTAGSGQGQSTPAGGAPDDHDDSGGDL